jgi:hypothetical protein
LTFTEIAAWCGVTGIVLQPSETDALMMLDRVRWKVAHE